MPAEVVPTREQRKLKKHVLLVTRNMYHAQQRANAPNLHYRGVAGKCSAAFSVMMLTQLRV